MIDLREIYAVSGLTFAQLIILLVSLKHERRRNFDTKVFLIMILLTMTGCVMETITFMIDGHLFFGARAINIVLNSLLFCIDSACGYLWAVYISFRTHGSQKRVMSNKFLPLPFVMTCALVVANLFTNDLFTISAENVYARQPMIILPGVARTFYAVYIVCVVMNRRIKHAGGSHFPILLYAVPVIGTIFIQQACYGITVIWAGLTMAMSSVFAYMQTENSLIDPMTSLYNRKCLQMILKDWLRPGQKPTAGIMLDIDRFKSINDTYGHSVGDEAIRSASELLRNAAPDNGIVFRYAGDEFTILLRDSDMESALNLVGRINMAAEELNSSGTVPYRLHFSQGCAMSDGKTADDFLHRMDQMMYEDKRRNHSEQSAEGGAKP